MRLLDAALAADASWLADITGHVREVLRAARRGVASDASSYERASADVDARTRVLWLANSPRWGGGTHRVTSVADACVRLGPEQVSRISQAVAAERMYLGLPPRLARRQVRLHELTAEGACALATAYPDLAPSVAYTAGLLHDVGEIVGLTLLSDHGVDLTEPAGCAAALAHVQGAHEQIGRIVLNACGAPPAVVAAAGNHHPDDDAVPSHPLGRIVYSAWRLAIQVADPTYPVGADTKEPPLALMGAATDAEHLRNHVELLAVEEVFRPRDPSNVGRLW